MPTTSSPIVRRYHPQWWLRIFALGFFAFSSAGLIHFWSATVFGGHQTTIMLILVPALLTLIGLAMSIQFFTSTVTLEADVIELRNLVGMKRLALSEIRGRCEYETTDSDGVKARYIVLEPRDPSRPRLKLQRIYNFDSEFETWLQQIPPVDR